MVEKECFVYHTMSTCFTVTVSLPQKLNASGQKNVWGKTVKLWQIGAVQLRAGRT